MKKYISLLLCAALVLTLTGCKPGNKPEETQTTQDSTPSFVEVPLKPETEAGKYEDVELRFLTLMGRRDPQAAAIEQAVRTFEARFGAKVSIYWLDGNVDLLASNFSEGTAFDIFAVPGKALPSDYLDYALDLTELAKAAGYENHSYEVLRKQVINRCGYLAGIPYVPYLYGIYYNREYFEQCEVSVPRTWDDFLEMSVQIKEHGFEPLTLDAERTHIVLELHLQRGLGSAKLDSLLLNGGWSKDEEAIELLQRAIDYADQGYLAKYSPASYPGGQNRLAMSNVVMTVGDNTLCSQVEQAAIRNLRWGVFPYPGDSDSSGVFVDSDVLCINRNSEQAQAAFDLIMMLSCGEFDQLRADLYGGIPADPDNDSVIYGAKQYLQESNGRSPGRYRQDNQELFTRLWNGWYKTARYYANALEGIKG